MNSRKTQRGNTTSAQRSIQGKPGDSPLSKGDRLHHQHDEGFETPASEVSRTLKKKSEELKMIDRDFISFSYVSSNDLQEPLRKIQTFSSRILEKEIDNLSERGKEYFARLQRSANRMQRIIDDLVIFSQLTLNNFGFEEARVNDLLNEVIVQLQPQIATTGAVIEYGDLGNVFMVRNQFKQLLQNLIGNALKFSRDKGTVIISISAEIQKGSKLKSDLLVKNRKYYHLRIKDNGIGFDAHFCDKIFEVFQRLHGQDEFDGTGIGLAICKKIVENHSGIICAEGHRDKGATFDIYLPVR